MLETIACPALYITPFKRSTIFFLLSLQVPSFYAYCVGA
jgi:hypothetical protein